MKTASHLTRFFAATATALAILAAGLIPGRAYAWGADGHRLVASLAYERLSPQAAAWVDALLAQEPGATLESVSTWADEIKARETAPWHYVDMPREASCHYEAARDCRGGQCLVQAIHAQMNLLRSSSASNADRLVALKFVVHLVADAEQPLHAGYRDDKGGNTYQVQAFGRGTNLHAVWDSGLIRNWPGGLRDLKEQVRAASLKSGAGDAEPSAWAEESCRYVGTMGFYPDGHLIGAAYQERYDPVVVLQLAKAVARLGAALETSARVAGQR